MPDRPESMATSDGWRAIGHEGGHYLLAKALPAVSSLVSIMVFTRVMSASAFGDYSLVISTVSLGLMVGLQWTWLAGYRYCQAYAATGFEERREYIGTLLFAFTISALITVAIWLLLTLISPLELFGTRRTAFAAGTALLVSQASFLAFTEINRAAFKSKRYLWLFAAQSCLVLLLPVGLSWALHLTVTQLVLAMAATYAVPLAVAALWSRRAWWGSWRFWSPGMARLFAGFGLPLTGTYALEFVLSASDRYLLDYYLGAGSVGIYTAGYRIAEYTIINIFVLLGMAIHPHILAWYENDRADLLQRRLSQTAELYLVVMLPVTAAIAYLGPDLARIFFGSDFRAAGPIISWVGVGVFLLGWTKHYLNWAFQLRQKTYLSLWALGPAAVLNVLLNVLLIPGYGAVAAAYATVVGYAALLLFTVGLARRVFPLPWPWRETGKCAGAVVALLAVMYLCRWLPLSGIALTALQLVLGFLTYYLALVALRDKLARSVAGRLRLYLFQRIAYSK